MSDDLSKLTMEYQRRLRELQSAQADQARIQAAIRRLAIDRPRLNPAEADRQGRALDAALAQAEAQVLQRRLDAEDSRRAVRRVVEGSLEPSEMNSDDSEEGFHQPPFVSGR